MQSGRNWNEYPAAKWRRVIKHVLISQTHCEGSTARGGVGDNDNGRQRPTANVDNASQLPIGAVGRQAGSRKQQSRQMLHTTFYKLRLTEGKAEGGARGARGAGRQGVCARRCCVFVVGAVKIQ